MPTHAVISRSLVNSARQQLLPGRTSIPYEAEKLSTISRQDRRGYLRHILGFIGITDVTFVQAGGTMRVAQGQVSSEEFMAPLLKQIKAAV